MKQGKKYIILIFFTLISLLNTSCIQKNNMVLISGKTTDNYGNLIDSVKYDVYINGKLRKEQFYGENVSVLENNKKIDEYIAGYHYSDSIGGFSIAIIEKCKETDILDILFIKENYEEFVLKLKWNTLIDTNIIMKKTKI